MKLSYKVHRVSKHPFVTDVKLPTGETAAGAIHSIEVELVSLGHFGGTILHRFIGAAAAEAEKLFHEGQTIIADFGEGQ